jgi:hypothetical protein
VLAVYPTLIKSLGTIALSCSLTFLSLLYQNPPHCKSFCWQTPCKPGQCNGIQTGFPFPFIFDDTGGSPISGWGNIGIEDFQNFDLWKFGFNFLFYSVVLLVIFKAIALITPRLK